MHVCICATLTQHPCVGTPPHPHTRTRTHTPLSPHMHSQKHEHKHQSPSAQSPGGPLRHIQLRLHQRALLLQAQSIQAELTSIHPQGRMCVCSVCVCVCVCVIVCEEKRSALVLVCERALCECAHASACVSVSFVREWMLEAEHQKHHRRRWHGRRRTRKRARAQTCLCMHMAIPFCRPSCMNLSVLPTPRVIRAPCNKGYKILEFYSGRNYLADNSPVSRV